MTLTPLQFVGKFWHWFAIAGLVMVVLFMRGDLASLKARADKAETKAATLEKVNAENAKVIEGFTKQRIDNDKILAALGSARTANSDRETTVRVAIEREAQRDPVVRNWRDAPIPSGVQSVLNSPPGD